MNIHDSDIRRVAFQEGEALGIEKGISEGAEQTKIQTAKNLFAMNLSCEQIAQATELPLEKVQEIEEQLRIKN